ncbi:hypothetical protein CHH70_09310 [Shouchella clausii]|nr:hypothetical protein CHH70_09310 [Shouchella clausii]
MFIYIALFADLTKNYMMVLMSPKQNNIGRYLVSRLNIIIAQKKGDPTLSLYGIKENKGVPYQ